MDTHDTPGTKPVDGFEVVDGRAPALLYPIADVAALLGISRSNVYKLVQAGQLTSVRIGARRLIPRDSVESFVEQLSAS